MYTSAEIVITITSRDQVRMLTLKMICLLRNPGRPSYHRAPNRC